MRKVSIGIRIGRNAQIATNVVIGAGGKDLGELVIGNNAIIRSGSVIYYGSKIGDNFKTGHNAVIREHNNIGNNVSVGSLAELNVNNQIGNYSSIHYGCFLERVKIGEYCFIAPGVIFLDDLLPVDPNPLDWKGAIVGNNVVIGGRSVVNPWIVIGSNVLIGSGSVITKNIPDGEVWFGNPAKHRGYVKNLKYRDGDSGYIPGNWIRVNRGYKK